MGKFVISNNKEWHDEIKKNYKDLLELKHYASVEFPIFLTTFQKKNVANENFLLIDSDFITTNGTLIYKEMMGKKSLYALYDDFKNETDRSNIAEAIKILRKNMYGDYAVILSVDNVIYIFGDESGSYPIYYGYKNGQFIVTNTFCNVQAVLKQQVCVEKLIEYGVCSFNIGKQTPFNNIYKVREQEYLEYKEGQLTVKKVELNYYGVGQNDEEAYEALKQELCRINGIRSKFIKRNLSFTTGGIDSRLGFALHEREGDDCTLSVWDGKDIITNGTDKDTEICRQLAELRNKEYRIMDVSMNFEDCMKKMGMKEVLKYGEYCSIYGNNEKWRSIFESDDLKDYEWIEFGASNALLKTVSYLEDNWHDGFTEENLIKDVFMRSGLYGRVFVYESFINEMKKSLKDDTENEKKKCVEDFDRIFNYYNHAHAGEILSVYANTYVYSFSLFREKRIFDLAMKISYESRANNGVSIRLTRDICPELLDVPYFTHHHTMLYNKNKGEVEELLLYKLIYGLRNALKGTPIFEPLNHFGHKIKSRDNVRNQLTAEILAICQRELENNKTLKKYHVTILNPKDDTGYDLPAEVGMVAMAKIADIVTEG